MGSARHRGDLGGGPAGMTLMPLRRRKRTKFEAYRWRSRTIVEIASGTAWDSSSVHPDGG